MPKTKKPKEDIEKPVWLKYTQEEVKAIILKLADKGLSAEKIGLTLRDQYGIPRTKVYNLKISRVIKEKKDYIEPTQLNLQKKSEKIEKHYKKNKQDKTAQRSLTITKAKLKKINDYLQKKSK